MIRYRIYTEELNINSTIELINKHLSSCSVFRGVSGMYKGQWETSLIIEYIGTGNEKDTKDILRLCKDIKELNHQECILLTRETVDSQLI